MIHLNAATRVTFGPISDGGTPIPGESGAYRVTFQPVSKQGRKYEFVLADDDLGRTDTGTVARVFKGWRRKLTLKWSYALSSMVEQWDGSKWVVTGWAPTAQAVWMVNAAADSPDTAECRVWVEPYAGDPAWPGFMAAPLDKAPKWGGGLAQLINRDLTLELEAVTLTPRIHAVDYTVTFSRASVGYGLDGAPLGVNAPAEEEMLISPAAFTTIANLPRPFVAEDAVWSYATTVARLRALADTYPEAVVYEDMSRTTPGTAEVLMSGREQSALRIFDDGLRPTVVLHTAIHGNERHAIRGFYQAIVAILTSSDPLLTWARNNLAFHWVALPNPDGAFWNKRGLGDWASLSTDRNGNREYPYFWERAIDPGKGPTPLADLEIRNIVRWMEPKVARALIVCDVHMWFTQTVYGWLTDHVWRSPTSQALYSAIYNYTNALMQQRDYTGMTLTAPSGTANMVLSYRSKAFKPYFECWCAPRMRPDGVAFQVEQPQAESQDVNGTMTLDLFMAILQGARDALEGQQTGFHLAPACAPANVLNTNSSLTAWNTGANRPQYMSVAGAAMTQDVSGGTGAGVQEVEMYRPGSAAWPQDAGYAAGCKVDMGDPATSFFVVTGGRRSPGPTTSTKGHLEYLAPPPPPEPGSSASSVYVPQVLQKTIASMPVTLENHALCTDGQYVYAVCGYGSSTYYATIYRIAVADILTGPWELWHTLTTYTGLQRHTAHVYDGKIFIVGGRDASTYKNLVVTVDLTTKAEAIFCALSTHYSAGFGWHNSVLVGSDLWVFGGWSGSTARTNVTRLSLATNTQTAMAPLPFSRRQAHVDYRDANGGEFWLFSGRGTTDYSEAIYRYSITGNTWTGFLADSGYTIEIPEAESSEDGDPITRPTFFRTSGYGVWNPVTETFLVVAGTDETDTPQASVWEFDPEAMAAHMRSTQDMLWGYIGPSTSPVVSPGKQVSFVSVVKNIHPETDLTIQPVVRPVIYVDPYGTPRKMFHKYVVAARSSRAIAMHADVESRNYASAQQVRARLRLYGGGTKLKLKWVQVTDVPYLAVPVDPVAGKAEDTLAVTFTRPLVTASKQAFGMCFAPRWGSQLRADMPVVVATCSPGRSLTALEVRWESQPTISAADWTPDEVATGGFVLRYTINGVTSSVALGTIKLNHDRYTSFMRMEHVYISVGGETGTGLRVKLWYYGKLWSALVPAADARVLGWEVPGTGTAVAMLKQ